MEKISLEKISITPITVGYELYEKINKGYTLFYVVSGEGELNAEGSVCTLEEGVVIALGPLSYLRITAATPLSLIELTYYKEALSERGVELSINAIPDEKVYFIYEKSEETELFCRILNRFSEIFSISEGYREEYAESLLHQLILVLLSAHGDLPWKSSIALSDRVIFYVNDNLTEDLSLDKIARHLFVTKHYLCRAFKAQTGLSVHSYITKKRMILASSMIASGELPSQVAYSVGFGDYSTFYRAYVKYNGCAPSQDQCRPPIAEQPADDQSESDPLF